MLALSDSQLRAVWAAADRLPVEKRGVFLERLIAQLQLRGSRFTTTDLEDMVHSALSGLAHRDSMIGLAWFQERSPHAGIRSVPTHDIIRLRPV
jgi:hypothetical protein